MKLLMDTHAYLWLTGEPERLSQPARDAMEDLGNELWLSSVSLFELATKVRLGKLSDPGRALHHWEWTLAKLSAQLLALSGSEAVLAGGLSVPHRDPFDRLLAAQAMKNGHRLVTRDPAFAQFTGLDTLW